MHVDVVDANGRAFDPSDATAQVNCPDGAGRIGITVGEHGYADVVAGDCTVSARRFQGPFIIDADPVPLTLAGGDEEHVEIELPTDVWGGIGVTVGHGPEGPFVRSLVAGTDAGDRIPLGAILVAVDGQPVGDLRLDQIVGALTGPEGTQVEVTYREPGADGADDQTVVLGRRAYKASGVELGAGPAG